MRIITLFAQRKCRYFGEYAPELIASIDEYGNDDNPDYMNEQVSKAIKSDEFSQVERITIEINDADFDKIFSPKTITAVISEVGNL